MTIQLMETGSSYPAFLLALVAESIEWTTLREIEKLLTR